MNSVLCDQSFATVIKIYKINKISLHVVLFSFLFLTKDTCNHIFFFILIDLILNCSFVFNCSKTGLCHDLIDFGRTKRVVHYILKKKEIKRKEVNNIKLKLKLFQFKSNI